jgi:hypothetical protein
VAVNRALDLDPTFYDALVLKAASLGSLGNFSEVERVKMKLMENQFPVPNFGYL